jgi:hypothetical protein
LATSFLDQLKGHSGGLGELRLADAEQLAPAAQTFADMHINEMKVSFVVTGAARRHGPKRCQHCAGTVKIPSCGDPGRSQ